VEFVEVQARTVESAIQAALAELGIEKQEYAEIEILQEPDKGFLGIGRTDAIVRVKEKPKPKRRRRRGRGSDEDSGERRNDGRDRDSGRSKRSGGSEQTSGKGRHRSGDSKSSGDRKQRSGGGSSSGSGRSGNRPSGSGGNRGKEKTAVSDREAASDAPETDINEQADVVREFLDGLLSAFGLEGDVDVSVDGNFILANINGEQTEALIGHKAAILQSIHELTKTVVQRRTQSGARLRLDIGGYAERRRQALTIYASRLAEQVLEEGEEVMLEPMNPPDRKVVHDAVAEIDGVRSFSEGEEPRRSVVIAPD
jgi:spoIIIJ-associated protein